MRIQSSAFVGKNPFKHVPLARVRFFSGVRSVVPLSGSRKVKYWNYSVLSQGRTTPGEFTDQQGSPVGEHLHLELLFLPSKGGDAKKPFSVSFCVSDLSQCNQLSVAAQVLFVQE